MYRQDKRFDALLAILGERPGEDQRAGRAGRRGSSVSGDAEAMRGIVEAARAKMKADPDKFGYGTRLAVALLALEAKQYETAGEFFNLALAAKPKQAAEVLMVWGVGLLIRASAPPRRPRCSSAASTRRRCRTTIRPCPISIWPAALAVGDRPTRPWPPPGRPPR